MVFVARGECHISSIKRVYFESFMQLKVGHRLLPFVLIVTLLDFIVVSFSLFRYGVKEY